MPTCSRPPLQVGSYKPHWQLLPPRLPLPPSLRPALALLECPDLYRLVWHLLGAAAGLWGGSDPSHGEGGRQRGGWAGGGGVGASEAVSEDVCLSCLNLLSLQLHHLKGILAEPHGGASSPQSLEAAAAVDAAVAALWGGSGGGCSYRRGTGGS